MSPGTCARRTCDGDGLPSLEDGSKLGTMPETTLELFLPEEVTLLALSEDKGAIEIGSWYEQVTAGAVLAELMLRGRVRVQSDEEVRATRKWYDKSAKLLVVDPAPVGDPLADEWLVKIGASPKLLSLGDWVSKISDTKKLLARVAGGLVERGILSRREDKVLWVFDRVRYPEADAAPEALIRRRLTAAIFEDTVEIDVRTVVLLSLVKGGEFLPHLFDKKALKTRRAHIDQIIAGEKLGAATAELIESIQAVVIASIVAASVVVTTS